MTVSTDGQICYGVLFEEDYEFPWDKERWDNDIDNWWLFGICGYTNPFDLFDEFGNWLGGKKPSEERVSEYFAPRRAFREEHPIPVELVNCCSVDYPMYILSVLGSSIVASRGHPVVLPRRDHSDHTAILGTTDEERNALLRFCEEYELKYTEGPCWWLSSYWG